MRNLATVQKILNIRPIPGADMIEAVDVLGWTVVSQKGIHTVGDLVVYFEIDSFLDATDPRYASFEERFINWGDKRGMRLKTIKLRKQISQGLILSLKQFPEIVNPTEGMDVTETLKIEKWESLSEANSNGGGMGAKTAGSKPFPSFIRKTDQERVQNRIGQLMEVADESFEATIKLDGSSMTVFHLTPRCKHYDFALEDMEIRKLRNMGKVKKFFYGLMKKVGLVNKPAYLEGVCSRNIQLDTDGDNHFSKFVKDNNILEGLRNLNQDLAFQGELIGPSIQENYEKVDGLEYYIYDVFNINTQEYMLPAEARLVCELVGLNYVPVLHPNIRLSDIGEVNPENMRELVEKILVYAEGPGMNKGVKREGVVFKSNKSSFSFKAISNSYLLAKEKK